MGTILLKKFYQTKLISWRFDIGFKIYLVQTSIFKAIHSCWSSCSICPFPQKNVANHDTACCKKHFSVFIISNRSVENEPLTYSFLTCFITSLPFSRFKEFIYCSFHRTRAILLLREPQFLLLLICQFPVVWFHWGFLEFYLMHLDT